MRSCVRAIATRTDSGRRPRSPWTRSLVCDLLAPGTWLAACRPAAYVFTATLTRKSSRSFFRFDAEVDWRERHEFLKFELPLNIKNNYATCETQFRHVHVHVQRPTHKNTTWDMAKFARSVVTM